VLILAETGAKITRLYGNFRGIDLRGEECALTRSPDCKNVWRNYKELASIETRPGLWVLWGGLEFKEGEQIYRIAFYEDKPVVITNYGLYTTDKKGDFTEVEKDADFYNIKLTFEFGDSLYIIDQICMADQTLDYKYYKYDGTEVVEVDPYIPTTSIGRTPKGEGTPHDDINILTNKRINEFTPNGVDTWYYLDTPQGIEKNTKVAVYDMSTGYQYLDVEYSVEYTHGIISFKSPPKKAEQDNIRVEFLANESDKKNAILSCEVAQVFDNRIFLGGSPENPNRIWYSKLNAPNYFSDTDYSDDGTDSAKIKGMVAGNNALWVFREPSVSNTNIFYHVPSIDEVDGKIYPYSHSSVSLGCIGGAINFNDDIVFFSPNGMEGISADITTEQFASHRSSAVDRLMTSHKDYKNMLLQEWRGYLLVIMGKDIYLADSRAVYQNEGHMEYEWYYWDLDKGNAWGDPGNVVCTVVHDDELYFATDKCRIYSLTWTGTNRDCESYWTTPKDKFDTPQKTKTTNKRGCVVEGYGDINVYAKTEDTEYELVGEFTDVKDYLVPRIKQKKFKDLQLKFESKTSFKLESVTIEAVVGGYIKR
jgi:hypothetical protein